MPDPRQRVSFQAMHIITILTCALMAGTGGLLLFKISRGRERTFLFLCLLMQLPMSWLAYHGLRAPLDEWLRGCSFEASLLAWLRTAYAPLTEEPAKLWPLLLPAIRQGISLGSAGRFAFALGLGFAIGEAVMVANLMVLHDPKVSALPWYALSGFLVERFMTGAVHGGMTAVALVAWRSKPGLVLGLAGAMVVHYLGNFPIFMAGRGWLGSNPAVVQLLLFGWVCVWFVASLVWLARLQFGGMRLGVVLFGHETCPSCGREYPRPLLWAMNFGCRRYERCPLCGKWHMCSARRKGPPLANPGDAGS